MAIVANTRVTYDTVGIREDLTDAIYNISPDETPFMSNAGRATAKQTLHEWEIDDLEAPDSANAQLEADDITSFDTTPQPTRIGNYVQISRKTAIIGGTAEAVEKAGRDSELAYQLSKKSKELKRDMETICLTNLGANAGAVGVARQTGTLGAFVKTNTDHEGTGSDPVYTNIPTDPRNDGATRAFTETILKTVHQLCWASGANTSTLMVGGLQKQVVSGFAGIATKTYYQSAKRQAAIIGAADIYVGDFGTLSVVPNRFQRNRDAWFLDFEFVDIMYLRKFHTIKLAKTGDAEKRMLLVEWGLKVKNEAALGLAADLS